MRRLTRDRLCWAALLFLVLAARAPAQGTPPEVKIGLPANLFRDIPRFTIDALLPTFARLMESQTGVRGQPVLLTSGEEVSKQLAENKVQLAVYHGHEYAWAQSRYKDLKPLVVAVSQTTKLTAQVIVAKESKFETLADLRGHKVAIPNRTREYARLFLARRVRNLGERQDKFFGGITSPVNAVASLDDVATGRIQAAVVEGAAWENFQYMNPAKAAKLRSLMQSEPFPTGVIVYKDGGLPAGELKKFKDGLMNAHNHPDGRTLMTLWRMSQFEDIPADYQQTLSNIARAYPPPIGDEK